MQHSMSTSLISSFFISWERGAALSLRDGSPSRAHNAGGWGRPFGPAAARPRRRRHRRCPGAALWDVTQSER